MSEHMTARDSHDRLCWKVYCYVTYHGPSTVKQICGGEDLWFPHWGDRIRYILKKLEKTAFREESPEGCSRSGQINRFKLKLNPEHFWYRGELQWTTYPENREERR